MASSYSSHKMATFVRGHHVYKDIWTPDIGEMLRVGEEDSANHNKYAVAVMKDGAVVGLSHATISGICWFFLKWGGSINCHIGGKKTLGTQDLVSI